MGWSNVNNPDLFELQATRQFLRPGARTGLWCGLILPIATLLSARAYQNHLSLSYHLAVTTSWVCFMYLLSGLLKQNGLFAHLAIITTAIVLDLVVLFTDLQTAIRFTCIAVLCSVRSPQALNNLLKCFPLSFSLGEAILVIQGSIMFFVTALANCYDETTASSTIFSQILLLGTVIFLTIAGQVLWLQKSICFIVVFIAFMGVITLPAIGFILGQNPIIWFFTQYIFVTSERVLVLMLWSLCTVAAFVIAWRYGEGTNSQALTVLRKYFHAVIVAIYLPGALFDLELLSTASVIVLAGFLFLETVRLSGDEVFGDILNKKTAGFLDEKDSGKLILTHIYLLVGCSLPIWIFPLKMPTDGSEFLLLCSGIISLGIGDAAASIGGTLWGKTKIFGSNKSVEGTLSSIAAEVAFAILLYLFGIVRTNDPLPLLIRFLLAASFTSVVEAITTQVDNLVLPLVMYICLIL